MSPPPAFLANPRVAEAAARVAFAVSTVCGILLSVEAVVMYPCKLVAELVAGGRF